MFMMHAHTMMYEILILIRYYASFIRSFLRLKKKEKRLISRTYKRTLRLKMGKLECCETTKNA